MKRIFILKALKMWFSLTVFVVITVGCLPGTYGKCDIICRKLCLVNFTNEQLNFVHDEVLVKMAETPCQLFVQKYLGKRCQYCKIMEYLML